MDKIKIDDLADAIASELEEYADGVADELKKEIDKTAKETVKELKKTSPRGKGSRKGHYAEGWRVKTNKESSGKKSVVIYNKNKPGLTHLLENGHANRGGGRTEGIPHIGPAEQHMVERYEKNVKERLGK